jgi:hypothetical protein
MQAPKRLEDDLFHAAKGRAIVQEKKAWDYGWCVEKYRRSADAAITAGTGQAVQLSSGAVTSLENAVKALLERPAVTGKWDRDELWGVIASLVATLPWDEKDPVLRAEIRRRVALVQSPEPTLVAFPLANVRWEVGPVVVADAVLGHVSSAWLDLVRVTARGRAVIDENSKIWWLEDARTREGPESPVAIATWSTAQGQKATDISEERFNAIVSVALLLETDPDRSKLFSLRGPSHRPGVRGLVIDREALNTAEPDRRGALSRELAAHVYQRGQLGTGSVVHWYGEAPFPLDEILSATRRKESVEEIVIGHTAIHRRLQVAARWYATAHWSIETEDAILALGIALDALLAEAGGSPGRVLAERFALLERLNTQRAARSKYFRDVLYPARSAIAHGGRSADLDDPDFPRKVAAEVRWVAGRIQDLLQAATSGSESDHRELFEGLKWGTAHW